MTKEKIRSILKDGTEIKSGELSVTIKASSEYLKPTWNIRIFINWRKISEMKNLFTGEAVELIYTLFDRKDTVIKEKNEMVKHKYYLSGPITGCENYLDDFATAERCLQSKGLYVINPAKANSTLPPETDYEDYMSMSFVMMNLCDTIVLLDGWEESKGVQRELEKAKENGMHIMLFKDLFKND